MGEEIRRFRARVYGVVQGVGFRWFVRHEAQRNNVVGYVRNLADGSVEVEAQGKPQDLEKLLSAIKKGPPAGIVTKVDVEWLPPTDEFHTFEIRF